MTHNENLIEADQAPPQASGGDSARFAIATAALALIAAQSGIPSPLYPLYAEHWDLLPLTMSMIFSVYILGLAITLLMTGALSDHVGRRPVAFAALFFAVVATAVLASAHGVGELLVARMLQGVSSGLGLGALGAALLDYASPSRHRFVAMLSGALPPVSVGIGAVVTGALVEFSPHPFRMPYLVFLLALLPVVFAALALKDKHPRRPGAWQSLVPSMAVPEEIRERFLMALGCLCASWSLLGLYLGIGPTITRTLFSIHSPTLAGVAILVVTGSGGIVGVLTLRLEAFRVMALGGIALAVGAGLMVVAVVLGNVWLYFAVSMVGGAGFGAACQGGLRIIVADLPTLQRGSVLSSLYLFSCIAFGAPTLVAGLLIPWAGLENTVYGYAAFVVVLSLLALWMQVRARATYPYR